MSTRGEITQMVELTPPGRGAVAVVLVDGPQAVLLVDAAIHRAGRRSLCDSPVGRIRVARWGSPDGEELVVCRRGPATVEIHCHGGAAAVEAVMGRLGGAGCQRIGWKEWIRRGAADPIRAAAQIALADAPTERTAAILLDQLAGALSAAVRQVVSAAEAGEWSAAISVLESILMWRGVGLHLARPWRVVLAGRPNVGKSSLLNALVGFERAIVYDRPGTTRDVVTSLTAIDGWPVLLADTAGLREALDKVEAAGVDRAAAAATAADLVLLVDEVPAGEVLAFPSTVNVLRVLNKLDLHHALDERDRRQFDVCVSAIDGTGISALTVAIGKALVPVAPAVGEPVAFEAEQIAQLDAALAAARQKDASATIRCLQLLLV